MKPLPLRFALWTLGCLALCRLQAQETNPPPMFEVSVTPTNMSIFVTGTTNDAFVTISNAALFTNITVIGAFGAQTNIPFLDSGAAPDATADDGIFSAQLVAPLVSGLRTQALDLVIQGDAIPADPPPDPLPPPVVTNVTVNYLIVVPPFNDMFTNAVKIPSPGGVLVSSNSFATLEPGEPVHAGVGTASASVWWLWPSPVTANVLVDLAGTDFDAVLAVYTGASVSNLTLVAAATNDTARNLKAHVNINAQMGGTYRIAVAGLTDDEAGLVRLRVEPGALPDTNGPLVSITSPASQTLVTVSNVLVQGTAKERIPKDSGVRSVWLQVNNRTNLVQANGTTSWEAGVSVSPGLNLIKAYAFDYAGNKGPIASIAVRFLDPVNDYFSQASVVTGDGGVVTADVTNATREDGEPLHAGNQGGHSIWYRWRAPFTGELYVTTGGSDFDTVLAVYSGTALTNLIEIASNDDAYPGDPYGDYSEVLAPVLAGQEYYIAVDGLGGATGFCVLSYSFNITETLYELAVAASPGGTVLPSGGYYAPGATAVLYALPDRNFMFLRWEELDGTPISTERLLPVFMDRNYAVMARFRVKDYTDTFASGELKKLPWSSTGQQPWSVERVDGQYAARSGVVGDGQSSSLFLKTFLYTGTIVFDLKVSSEEGWDWLEFYVNGVRQGRWSGEVDWNTHLVSVNQQGNADLEWRYVKDANYSKGLDAAFIDNVYLPLEKPSPPLERPTISLEPRPNQTFQLTVIGQPNTTCIIQVSPDLRNWTPVLTNQLGDSVFQWTDPVVAGRDVRFYRVLTQ